MRWQLLTTLTLVAATAPIVGGQTLPVPVTHASFALDAQTGAGLVPGDGRSVSFPFTAEYKVEGPSGGSVALEFAVAAPDGGALPLAVEVEPATLVFEIPPGLGASKRVDGQIRVRAEPDARAFEPIALSLLARASATEIVPPASAERAFDVQVEWRAGLYVLVPGDLLVPPNGGGEARERAEVTNSGNAAVVVSARVSTGACPGRVEGVDRAIEPDERATFLVVVDCPRGFDPGAFSVRFDHALARSPGSTGEAVVAHWRIEREGSGAASRCASYGDAPVGTSDCARYSPAVAFPGAFAALALAALLVRRRA